ncbi:MAG TPA: radical SAM protein [Candidatus Nanoarchaeia archaeon]|nr:radical SAM protein [Candidatus Nanoarchaeia archaeon]
MLKRGVGVSMNKSVRIRKKKIILIYPNLGIYGKIIQDLPLALLQTARIVYDKGYDILILDQRLDDNWKDTLKKEINKDTLFVALSAMIGEPINYALEIAKFMKDNYPEMPVLWGGIHPTLLPLQTLEHPLVDIVIKGDGEETIYDVAQALEKGKSLKGIPGVFYKEKDGTIVSNPVRAPSNLDVLPPIPYNLVNIEAYERQGFKEKTFTIFTSASCPHRCAFCHVPGEKSTWRPESVDRTMKHLRFIYDTYHPQYIYFGDNDFFVRMDRAKEIFARIKEEKFEGVTFGFRGTRIDELDRMDDTMLSLMEEINLTYLHIGAESGSQRILDFIWKDIKVEQTIRVNQKLAHHPKLHPSYNFFCGVPTETKADLKATTDLILRLLKDNPNSQISSATQFTPYPGTRLFDIAIQYGFQPPTSLEGWAKFDPSDFAKRLPWLSKERQRLLDLIYITAWFVDKKVNWNFTSDEMFWKVFRTLSSAYRPIAKFRLKHHFTGLPFEYPARKIFFNILENRN